MSTTPLKTAARVYVQSTNYTDTRVAELESELNEIRFQRYADNRKSLKERLALHAMLLLFGAAVSAALIAYAASPLIMVIITTGPSVITEIIDFLKRF